MRGGGLQRENLKENTTFCKQNYGTRGLAQSKMNTFDCEVLGGGTSTAPVCDGLGDDDDCLIDREVKEVDKHKERELEREYYFLRAELRDTWIGTE